MGINTIFKHSLPVTFILCVNVVMSGIASGNGVADAIAMSMNIRSIAFGLISVVLVIYTYRIYQKKDSINENIVFYIGTMALLYVNYIMGSISHDVGIYNILLSLKNKNVLMCAALGAVVVTSIKTLFEKVGIAIHITYPSSSQPITIYVLQGSATFILLQTNICMDAFHFSRKVIESTCNPNVIAIAIVGIILAFNLICIYQLFRLNNISKALRRSLTSFNLYIAPVITLTSLTAFSIDVANAKEIINEGIPAGSLSSTDFHFIGVIVSMAILCSVSTIYITKFLSTYKERQIREGKLIGLEDICALEENASQILVLTETLRFENTPVYWEKLTGIMQKNMNEYVVDRVEKDDIKTVPKYKFIVRDDKLDDIKKEIIGIYFKGQGVSEEMVNEFMTKWVGSVEQKYFDLLRPFPERTYITISGASICDIVTSKTGQAHIMEYEKVKGDRDIDKLINAFNNILNIGPGEEEGSTTNESSADTGKRHRNESNPDTGERRRCGDVK